jgi:alkanesulfonate monooxygenase
LSAELLPQIFISGSSEAGLAAARTLGATAVKYPKPASDCKNDAADTIDTGVRVGIIARGDSGQAWRIAHERFPEDRKGQLNRQLANKVSDSVWHKELSRIEHMGDKNPYWLFPFQNYKTNCPYLVGSYGVVAEELARYIGVGHKAFILDIPPTKDELKHARIAFQISKDPGRAGAG